MLRYWKLISISIITVLTIGAFYIQSAMASNNYPEFVLDTQSGNKDEISNITIRADYREGINGEYAEITSEGTMYASEQSFLDRLGGMYTDADMERLQKNYRNFMRGKDNIWAVFEDQNILAYADINDHYIVDGPREFTFDIDILEKDSSKTRNFTINIPEKNKYNYVQIEDVQVLNNEMIVTTVNHSVNGNEWGSDEIHVYRFNITDEKLVTDEVIQVNPEHANVQFAHVNLIHDQSDIGSAEHLVFIKEYMKEVQHEDGSYYLEPNGSELIAYNLKTNELETIQLSEEIQVSSGSIYLNDSTLYIIELADKDIKVTSFNMDSKEIEKLETINLPSINSSNLNDHFSVKIKDGEMYLVGYEVNKNTEAPLLVIDLDSGKIKYEGVIITENLKKTQLEYILNIYEIELK
ncbi:hypothetical protein ACFOUV_13460 [Oceanobacillus longus]|uniref:Uncharacterized protein n=1 Tax=Oceanobacillus longus TaxID=930120 RepID=A0ABV8H1R7_9BACI